ncbi:MAG: DUF4926 domain-containing protein [Elusimicrobia bacterium]|nr:DUF4926 domain-containing protein [Elusimicrobiota bacterium]
MTFKLLDRVRLRCDIPRRNLRKGRVGTVVFIFDKPEKVEARGIISRMGLPPAQARSAISAISRGTTSSNFRIAKDAEDVVIQIARKGRDGHQIFEYRISQTGEKNVTQMAYDGAGDLVHFHPK